MALLQRLFGISQIVGNDVALCDLGQALAQYLLDGFYKRLRSEKGKRTRTTVPIAGAAMPHPPLAGSSLHREQFH